MFLRLSFDPNIFQCSYQLIICIEHISLSILSFNYVVVLWRQNVLFSWLQFVNSVWCCLHSLLVEPYFQEVYSVAKQQRVIMNSTHWRWRKQNLILNVGTTGCESDSSPIQQIKQMFRSLHSKKVKRQKQLFWLWAEWQDLQQMFIPVLSLERSV